LVIFGEEVKNMKKLVTKIGVGITAGAFATLLAVGPALAANDDSISCNISRNGRDSRNTCTITVRDGWSRRARRALRPRQSNKSEVKNKLTIDLNTGDNKANDTVGNNVDITTGRIDLDITIINEGNVNR